MWKSLSGSPVEGIVRAVQALLRRDECVVHVGTDSQQFGYHTDFVTAVAVVAPGHGGRIFYRRERLRTVPSLAHKLFHEAQLSLDVARLIHASIVHDIVVHVDANADSKHRSSRYVQALAGMVIGHGFQVRIKPESWCATHVADHLVKGKRTRPARTRLSA